ncbi:hypothetical protein FOA52_007669 [Chlamydomonas sp. UWO 241]|nr:hypothetical protein FOA52_007669 [Chlamydomonas sp. UWO 241]
MGAKERNIGSFSEALVELKEKMGGNERALQEAEDRVSAAEAATASFNPKPCLNPKKKN